MAAGSQITLNFPSYDNLTAVENIVELRNLISLNLTDRMLAICEGSVTSGDGGGSIFVYRSTATGADDGVNTILPVDLGPSEAGRWLRLNRS